MSFTDNLFGLFAFVFFGFYFLLQSRQATLRTLNAYLVVASLVFYGFSYPPALFLIFIQALLTYSLSPLLTSDRRGLARFSLIVLLTANLGCLALFKYYGFFRAQFALKVPELDLVLPLGLSFYTFTLIGYYIDLFRRELQPSRSFTEILTLIVFWPHLAAGPILRAKMIFQAVRERTAVTSTEFTLALLLIGSGLIKKLLIADNLGAYVNWNIDYGISVMSWAECATLLIGYGAQIYADFSGYSDMAIGFSLIMGFRLPANFNYPYAALSLREFWTRWHISLSTWFRDYLYIPLGGNRRGLLLSIVSILIVFTLSGLWHGAALNFILWGTLHGAFLCIERLGSRLLPGISKAIPRFVKWAYTISITLMLWAFFRLDLPKAILLLQKTLLQIPSLPFSKTSPYYVLPILGLSAFIALEHWIRPTRVTQNGELIPEFKPLQVAYVAILFPVALILSGSALKFIYFQY